MEEAQPTYLQRWIVDSVPGAALLVLKIMLGILCVPY
jgi:hypothetical protein